MIKIKPYFIVVLLLYLKNIHSNLDDEVEIEPKNFIISGFGIEEKFNLPVRYFYIQAVDVFFQNITQSIGKNFFEINILSGQSLARTQIQVLDRNDGSYIVRYRLYQSYEELRIEVRFKGIHVANSPYILRGDIYDEKCNCPEEDLQKWYSSMHCNDTYSQIELDMQKVNSIDMKVLRKKIINKYNQPHSYSICHYVIKENKIYRKCYGQHVGFNMFSDAILLSLTRKVKLPDVEFFMNLGDWPLASKRDEFLPIVSWCGSDESHDIILPTYELTEATLEMMGRQSLDIFSVQANTGPKWNEKLNKSFWRGRDSRQERLDLVLLSRKYPFLIDAGLTNMFFFREPEHMQKYGPLVKSVSFFDFFKHKYQINIDGTVAAYRLPYLLVGDSVVLKQDSNYYEHFYKDLKRNSHYIAIKHDLSDIIDNIRWSMDNDVKVQEIIKNAQSYSREFLQPHHIYCYHVKFFESYSKKLKSRVYVHNEMDEVKQKDLSNCKCEKTAIYVKDKDDL